MSMDKLQQAVALIRAGDKPGGQRLLAEVVTTDPGNEMAWLWLASVAPSDKRRYCLEKVLGINPNNAQARQLLEQLKNPEPAVQIPVRPESHPALPKPQDEPANINTALQPNRNTHDNTPRVAEQPDVSIPQSWTTPVGKGEVRIIMIQGARLIAFDMMPNRLTHVLAQINLVEMTKEWFEKNIALGLQGMSYKSAPLDRILRVRLLSNYIQIEYREETGEDVSTEIGCKKDEISEALMESLQKRLGGKYVRMSKPTSRKNLIVSSLIILFVPLCGTGFFYWVAQGIVGEQVSGSARVRSMERILQFLGPDGVLWVGCILVLIAIVIVIFLFVNPPMETLLVRKSLSSAKEWNIHPENLQAQQSPAQLKVAEPAVQIPVQMGPQPDSPKPQDQAGAGPQDSIVQVAEQPVMGVSEYWTVAIKKEVRVILFQGEKLIMFDMMPDRLTLVLSQVNQAMMTKQWLINNIALGFQQTTYQSIMFHQISHARLFLDSIKIDYWDETGKNVSARIDCRKHKISDAVMMALQNRLGDRFERVSKSISRWVVAICAALALLVTYYGTGFFYSLAQESMGQELQGRGKVLLLDAILKLLGPTGVGSIGCILLVLLLCFAALFFANPPVETLLIRKEIKKR